MSLAALLAQAPLAPEAVRRALERALGRGEVRRAALWQRIREWIGERLHDLLAPLGLSAGDLRWLALLLLGALLALVLVRVARELRFRRGGRADARSAQAQRERRVAELRRRAEEAFARGEHGLALRLWLFALLVGLGEKGELEYRDAWTSRELVERGNPSAAVRARLAPLLDELERASFGGLAVGADEAARVRDFVADWLAEARA